MAPVCEVRVVYPEGKLGGRRMREEEERKGRDSRLIYMYQCRSWIIERVVEGFARCLYL